MANVLRLALVDPKDGTREALKSSLVGLDTVWLEAECSRYTFFKDVLDQTTPDVAFIAMDSDPDAAVALIEDLSRTRPDVALLVASSSTDGSLILRTMRAGAKEFLPQPLRPDDLAAALQRIARTRSGKSGPGGPTCRVIAVTGSTGGVGSTSLAVNLGCELAQNPAHSVAVVDLDLPLGDADVYLDTIPEYTLTDVAQNVARLDLTLLKRSLTKHSSGVYLLPRPVQLDDARLVSVDDLQRVISLLKATFTHLILDTSKGFGPLDMLALDAADDVLMVTQLDLPCLRNVVRLMMSFDGRDGLKDSGLKNKVKIVVNRAGQGGISVKKAEQTLGREVYWQLPNDFRTMIEVRNNGVPLVEQAPKAAITQSIAQLARELTGARAEAADGGTGGKAASRSFFGLFGGKKGDEPAPAAG